MTAATLAYLLPEIELIAAAVAIYMGGAFSKKGTSLIFDRRGETGSPGVSQSATYGPFWVAGIAIVAAAILLWRLPDSATAGAALQSDHLANLVRWLALGLGILLLLPAAGRNSDSTAEYVGSLLLTVAGLMLVGLAGDLVLLFVSLELISIPTYVLLYLGRRDTASQESAAKYFFLSVLSSAIVLYGFSFLYGIAGSTELAAVRAALDGSRSPSQGLAPLARLALALVFGGLCFRITAVPFHFYAPDVYQGTTHSNAALLSVLPKAAGFVALARILVAAMPNMTPWSWQIVLAAAALSMTLGNVMALWQDDLRRLLAYSSIANAGYMLLALAVALVGGGGATAWDGLAAVGFYLAVYAVGTIGAFAVFQHLGRPERSLDGIDELAGLGATKPVAAAVLAVCMFSLAGLPIFAGFWGKFLVFGGALSVDPAAGGSEAVRWWFVAAAILGVLNAAVGAAYYLRIVALMYFRTPLATPLAQGGAAAWWAAVACALLLVGLGVYPGPLLREVERDASELGAVPDVRASDDRTTGVEETAAAASDHHAPSTRPGR